jgi:uncharacterized protein (DUF1501 family)
LNTVVPSTDPAYAAARPGLAIAAADVLDLDGQIGLHPSLGYLASLARSGHVAIVEGVGCADPDYSHFTSMGRWMSGSFIPGNGTGWIGRWLDGHGGELAGVSTDSTVPLHMTGSIRRAVGVSPAGDGFGAERSDDKMRLFESLRDLATAPSGRGPLHDLYAQTLRTQLDLASELEPIYTPELPQGELAQKLTVAARLINADLGVRVVDVGRSGFDHHEGEVRSHQAVLADLDAGLRAFFATLSPDLHDQVALMTVSEFGRTVASNGSGGTDHGSAAPLFVIGAAVRGGRYGQAPSLTSLDANRQMVATVDFRSVYGSIVDGWLGGGGQDIVGRPFDDLRLFSTAPGTPLTGLPLPIVVDPPVSASGFVPLPPVRMFDTRDGTGGRGDPIAERETWPFTIRGSFGVPDDAVAAVFNLTSVDATKRTYVTAWPSGLGRPLASTLNPVPGRVVPNLAVIRLGGDGAVRFYNNSGSVHLVADLVGYFAPSSPNGLVPLVPSRLLDTRTAIGGRSGPVGAGEIVELTIADGPAVPAAVVAVALNVTATEPTDSSYLSVWPAGAPRPLASSVNTSPRATASTMAFSGVGSGRSVSVVNNSGETHLVADLLGCFAPDSPGRFVALSPTRVLDTRDGTGSPAGRVGGEPLVLRMFGRGGVPAASVGAVLLNITAVLPSRDTHLTVYPSGITAPLASNLNVEANEVRANLALVTLGSDGAICFCNNSGTVDVVADVLGYFVAG